MGRLDPGLVATLLFLIPGLWNSFSIITMPNLSAHFTRYLSSCFCSFGCDVGVPWLLYWLFLLGFLVTKFYGSRALPRKKRTGSRRQKIRRFRRRKLAFSMVLKCRDRLFSFRLSPLPMDSSFRRISWGFLGVVLHWIDNIFAGGKRKRSPSIKRGGAGW